MEFDSLAGTSLIWPSESMREEASSVREQQTYCTATADGNYNGSGGFRVVNGYSLFSHLKKREVGAHEVPHLTRPLWEQIQGSK